VHVEVLTKPPATVAILSAVGRRPVFARRPRAVVMMSGTLPIAPEPAGTGRGCDDRSIKGWCTWQARRGTDLDGPAKSDMMIGMFRAIVFFVLIASAFAGESLDPLLHASRGFSIAIREQILAINRGPSLIEFVAKTIVYAQAKTAYFDALRAAAPELMDIATGREARSPELDKFAARFSIAGERQEKTADEQTLFLLKQLSFDPDIEKARAEFEKAQKVEERFHHDFDGVDFT
jgi:hypothetical protein